MIILFLEIVLLIIAVHLIERTPARDYIDVSRGLKDRLFDKNFFIDLKVLGWCRYHNYRGFMCRPEKHTVVRRTAGGGNCRSCKCAYQLEAGA